MTCVDLLHRRLAILKQGHTVKKLYYMFDGKIPCYQTNKSSNFVFV